MQLYITDSIIIFFISILIKLVSEYLFGYPLRRDFDYIEVGGGYGDLSKKLIDKGYIINLFIEPSKEKYNIAKKILTKTNLENKFISNLDFSSFNPLNKNVCVIMQDVIEHIPQKDQLIFFQKLMNIYESIHLVGRTPNLKSIYGLRNSFGDTTHIHRFTNKSLENFLKEIGFQTISISHEPFRITGITSFLRSIPYHILISLYSITYLFIYGSWEGYMTPNIVFFGKCRK